ncbi:DUF4287 domain-containing protein [Protaetiibacter sp. SSC-01]|uniref:DUF4287 domain-containing protein n=1 Tax=Protaetiibacter sp. SSC-01 TaxID=2759943 RepID=UPI0016571595|nr:DUF4287 domain-containing protein [Protaetiibacter sp. SSC-01]QNO38074.1 DUF4287 domain-containing protein [Protaetiibacter sp. SSC-01]
MAIRGSDETVSDEALTAATGRAPGEWFALLDAAGATGWTHSVIADWLRAEHDVDPWWCQSITVRYEQARGLRLPGQQADGTFSTSTSRTVDGPLEAAYGRAVAAFRAELGEPASARDTGARPYARYPGRDAGSVLVTAEATSSGRVRVTATHERLTGPEAVADAKGALAGILARL